ncbi:hypothetical protein ACNS7O_07240 [Haloferacaceae archaeon DSL9]
MKSKQRELHRQSSRIDGSNWWPQGRRPFLRRVGGAALAATGIGGLSSAAIAQDGSDEETVEAYVASYHWGFAVYAADTQEITQISMQPGQVARLTVFHAGAEEARRALPDEIRDVIPSEEVLEERNADTIPVPEGGNLEALLEDAEANYPNHGLVVMPTGRGMRGGQGGYGGGQGGGGMQGGQGGGGMQGNQSGQGGMQGGQGGGGMHGGQGGGMQSGQMQGPLFQPVELRADASEPTVIEGSIDRSGVYDFVCTVYCGYGHPYMLLAEAVLVTD